MPGWGRFGGKKWQPRWRNSSGAAAIPRSPTDCFFMIKMQSVTMIEPVSFSASVIAHHVPAAQGDRPVAAVRKLRTPHVQTGRAAPDRIASSRPRLQVRALPSDHVDRTRSAGKSGVAVSEVGPCRCPVHRRDLAATIGQNRSFARKIPQDPVTVAEVAVHLSHAVSSRL